MNICINIRINFILKHKLLPCHQQWLLQVYWKIFTYTTDGIVVENCLLYNIMCVIQFVLFYFYFIHSCGLVMLLMLCIICISFYSISFCLFNYTLMLWVIMFWCYGLFLTSYVLADGIAILKKPVLVTMQKLVFKK